MAVSSTFLAQTRTRSNDKLHSFPIRVHDLNAEVMPTKNKRVRNLRKNPFNNFYKETVQSFKTKPYNKVLDGFLLIEFCKVENPSEAIFAKLNGQGICDIVEEHLKYFTNLSQLDLSDNFIKLEKLSALESLTDLNLMCNKITSIPQLSFPAFNYLETLNLSFNKIHATDIVHLSHMPKLETLDLSSNELCTLPEDLSEFRALRTLLLSSNSFSTDSVLFSAGLLFKSLSSIKYLQKLDISRNKLRGIHSELLSDSSFNHLKELDFSNNWVDSYENLIYSVKIKGLQILTVTSNPFVQTKEVNVLENILSAELGCTVIYEDMFSKKKTKQPIARPFVYVEKDYTSAIKNQLFGVELSKDMGALGMSEIDSREQDDEIFPPAIEAQPYKDIYTPSNDLGSSRPNREKNMFFVTGTDGEGDPTKTKGPRSKLEDFRLMAKMILADKKDYAEAFDLQTAYRQLRHMVKHPITYQTRKVTPNYALTTASRVNYRNYVRKPSSDKSKEIEMPKEEIDYISEEIDQYASRIRSV